MAIHHRYCFVCRKNIIGCMLGTDLDYKDGCEVSDPPNGAIVCTSEGNYGSAVWDSRD